MTRVDTIQVFYDESGVITGFEDPYTERSIASSDDVFLSIKKSDLLSCEPAKDGSFPNSVTALRATFFGERSKVWPKIIGRFNEILSADTITEEEIGKFRRLFGDKNFKIADYADALANIANPVDKAKFILAMKSAYPGKFAAVLCDFERTDDYSLLRDALFIVDHIVVLYNGTNDDDAMSRLDPVTVCACLNVMKDMKQYIGKGGAPYFRQDAHDEYMTDDQNSHIIVSTDTREISATLLDVEGQPNNAYVISIDEKRLNPPPVKYTFCFMGECEERWMSAEMDAALDRLVDEFGTPAHDDTDSGTADEEEGL
jgi:hypothetical protein